MRRIARACVAAILIVAAFAPLAGPVASAAPSAVLGLYPGPADITEMEAFSDWLGSPITYGADYADHTRTWTDIANPSWFIGPWSAWKAAEPGRRMVVSVPLLTESNRGDFDEGAAGAFDGYFRSLGQNLVGAGLGDSIVRLGWEMNNTSFPWYAGTDPDGYVAYYRRIVGVLRSVAGASFDIDWCPLAGVMADSPLTTFASFYPGDDVVDIIGLDNYDLKWQDTTSSPSVRWQFHRTRPLGLNDHKAFAAAHGKPMSFPEWGLYAATSPFGGGGDNPYYIDRMADWFATTPTAYQAYFNLDWGGGTLESFPNARARFRSRFGASPTTTTTSTTTIPSTTTTTVPTTTTTTTTTVPSTTTTTVPSTTSTTSGAVPAVSISDVSVTEGDSGTTVATFSVNLSASSPQPATVTMATVAGTALAGKDFVAKSAVLAFPAGRTKVNFTVLVKGDTQGEADETFTVVLSNPVNLTLGDGVGVATIVDDD